MLGFFSFLGLSFGGFSRKRRLVGIYLSLRSSRFFRHSIPYCMGVFCSLVWLCAGFFSFELVKSCNRSLSSYFLPLKCYANSLIELPKTWNHYLLQNRLLKEEICRLRMENDKLRINLTSMTDVKSELDSLKASLNFSYEISSYKVVERVLGFDRSVYESFMLISVTHNNIQPGDIVVSSRGLIGIIFDIHNSIARVMHICDSRLHVPVVSDSGDHFILSGSGTGKLVLADYAASYSSNSIRARKGATLVTSGEGGIFRYGIPVATISYVSGQSLSAVPVEKIDDVLFVWVVPCLSARGD